MFKYKVERTMVNVVFWSPACFAHVVFELNPKPYYVVQVYFIDPRKCLSCKHVLGLRNVCPKRGCAKCS